MAKESQYIKAKALQDESGHWYVVPNEEEDLFHKLQDDMSEGDMHGIEQMFEETFGGYRTNGDLNNKQLYVRI